MKSAAVDLDSLPEKLIKLKEVYEHFQIQAMSAYSNETTVILEVRKLKEHDKKLSDQEIRQLKKAIFEKTGQTFPLEIQSFAISAQPEMTGHITAVDGHRVLIVNPDKLIGTETKMQDAAWFSFSSDAIILDNRSGKPMSRGDLKIGFQVNVWGNGMMEESYPGQTSALRLEVTNTDTGDGEIQGSVEQIDIDPTDEWERYLIVEGQKYRLLDFTKYWIGENEASVQDIQPGDQVQVWSVGYEMGEERMASQIKVVSKDS